MDSILQKTTERFNEYQESIKSNYRARVEGAGTTSPTYIIFETDNFNDVCILDATKSGIIYALKTLTNISIPECIIRKMFIFNDKSIEEECK